MRLLLVQDDGRVGDALVRVLNARGHSTDRKRRGLDALISYRAYDAVILDLALPDIHGLQVLRQLRGVSSIPVMILTGPGDERAVVRALRGGADDCMVKPPQVGELIARLEKATKFVAAHTIESCVGVVVTLDVCVDLSARRVEVAGMPITLTHKEFELIKMLVERQGEAVSRQQLMDRVWGDAFVAVSRSLDVHMTWLRAKLNRPGLITTVRGFGYRWYSDPVRADAAS